MRTPDYSVNSRIAALQNAVAELQKENKEIRVHLGGQLQNLVREATSTIQASLRIPQDGKDGAAGRDGRDGVSIKGDKGEHGDITVYGDSELREAVNALRLKLLKWQSAIQFAYEQNHGTKSRGLQTAINAVLKKIEQDAQ